jgi:hypothetical protein
MLTLCLITLAVPALLLAGPDGMAHPGVVQALLLVPAFSLAWCIRDLVCRNKTDLLPYQACTAFYAPALAVCHTLNSRHRLDHKQRLRQQPAN